MKKIDLEEKRKRIIPYVRNVYDKLNNPKDKNNPRDPYWQDYKEDIVSFNSIEERYNWVIGVLVKLQYLHPEYYTSSIQARERQRAVFLLIGKIYEEFPEFEGEEKKQEALKKAVNEFVKKYGKVNSILSKSTNTTNPTTHSPGKGNTSIPSGQGNNKIPGPHGGEDAR